MQRCHEFFKLKELFYRRTKTDDTAQQWNKELRRKETLSGGQ